MVSLLFCSLNSTFLPVFNFPSRVIKVLQVHLPHKFTMWGDTRPVPGEPIPRFSKYSLKTHEERDSEYLKAFLKPCQKSRTQDGQTYLLCYDARDVFHRKAGCTTDLVGRQIAIRTECGYKTTKLYLGKMVPFAGRREDLLYKRFDEQRYQENGCAGGAKGCKVKAHIELFDVSVQEFKRQNQLLEAFCETSPYVLPEERDAESRIAKKDRNHHQLSEWWRIRFASLPKDARMEETDDMIRAALSEWDGQWEER
jgi:hypothetical protein